ncbi:MAG: J domain-containing protein [Gammaproteobacteria bacterium]|nr:J domain-containing protein [Gammaproteobacteria bacterium]
MDENLYDILGLSIDATQEEIKKSYQHLAKIFHPDKNLNTVTDPNAKSIAEEKFKAIGEAYATLGNEQKRKVYNLSLPSAKNYFQPTWKPTSPNHFAHFYHGDSPFYKPASPPTQHYTNEIPEYVYPLAEQLELDVNFVNECWKSNLEGLDDRYDRLCSLKPYLINFKKKKEPALNLVMAFALSRQEFLNLASAYELIVTHRITMEEVKKWTKFERELMVQIWNREFENPDRDEIILESLRSYRNKEYRDRFAQQKQSSYSRTYAKRTFYNNFFMKTPPRPAAPPPQHDDSPHRVWTEGKAVLLPNGFIISGGDKKEDEFKLFDPATAEIVNRFSQQGARVSKIVLLASGNIAVSSYDFNSDIKVFNPNTGELLSHFAYGDPCLRMIARNNHIVTVGNFNCSTVQTYDSESGNLIHQQETVLLIEDLISTPRHIIIAGIIPSSLAYKYQIYDDNLTLIKTFPLANNCSLQNMIMINENTMGIADVGSNVFIYNINSGEMLNKISTSLNAIRSMSMSDNNLLLSDSNGLICAYQLTGKLIKSYQTSDIISSGDILKTLYSQLNASFESVTSPGFRA